MTRRGPASEFGGIRRVIAGMLMVLLSVIVLWDAWSEAYKVDPLLTGSILGTIVSLVVVDVAALGKRR